VTDWPAVFAFAERSQVEAVALTNLAEIAADLLTPDIVAEARNRVIAARAQTLALTLVTGRIVKSLDRASITALVLKGPTIGVMGYGDPSLRRFNDIDLLVKRPDIPAAIECLIGEGFKRDYPASMDERLLAAEHAIELTNAGTKVELHTALVSRYLSVKFDRLGIWESAAKLECAGTQILTLPPDIQFLFLCVHGAKHEWMQLRWICDIAQLATRLSESDAARLLVGAQRLHATRLVEIALQLVHAVFGSLDLEASLSRIANASSSRGLVNYVRERLEISETAGSVYLPLLARVHPSLPPLSFWLRSRERLVDRITCLLRVGSPLRLATTALARLRTVR
jgi:hypothetical protein